jgi:hypothetical protein
VKAQGSCAPGKSTSAVNNSAAAYNRDCRATGRSNSAAEAHRSDCRWSSGQHCRRAARRLLRFQPTADGQPTREASSAKACWPRGSCPRSLALDGLPGDPSRIPAVRVRGQNYCPELPKRGSCCPVAAKTFPKEYFRSGLP